MQSGHVAKQNAELLKHGPKANAAADAYDLTPAQRKIFIEVVAGYLSTHKGEAPPNGYDQIANLSRQRAK
jgi:hypothetical protein